MSRSGEIVLPNDPRIDLQVLRELGFGHGDVVTAGKQGEYFRVQIRYESELQEHRIYLVSCDEKGEGDPRHSDIRRDVKGGFTLRNFYKIITGDNPSYRPFSRMAS